MKISEVVKKHWSYKKLKEYDYKISLTKNKLTIKFRDGDVYVSFKIKEIVYDGTWKNKPDYLVVVNETDQTVDLLESYDEAVICCLCYFWNAV